ncbi:MAG: SMEK domain-containing protein [Bacteroidetes bacterium]|nr:SMEK domain-containing protein [Bacteroidota bacterium]
MKRQEYINKITKYLTRFVDEVRGYNAANLYDINIHAENALIPILNLAFGVSLKNMNANRNKHFPGIDLGDKKNRIAFQVTASASIDKVKDTLETFGQSNLMKDYDTLCIYILTEKQRSYSQDAVAALIPQNFTFLTNEHIMDVNDLLRRISYIQSLETLEQLARLCEHEFSDSQIEQRSKKFKSGFLKNEPENLYVNFLKISFPATLYLADLSIDEDKIKERINNRRISAGKRRKNKFKKGELFFDELVNRNISAQDYILRENQLITFHNLFDTKEKLLQVVDKGTITKISSRDYYSTSESYLNNFKHLLRQALIELCKAKEIQWINAKELLRFRNSAEMPNIKKIKWKGKHEATKTVIFELMSKRDKEGNQHIICYRNMAFFPSFMNFIDDWYVVINPTWSFTNPGGVYPSRFEEAYLSGLKRQESNSTVYYQYRFFGYYLSYTDLFTSNNAYPYLQITPVSPLRFMPKLEDNKWLPPKEFVPVNERESELTKDSELNKTLFD